MAAVLFKKLPLFFILSSFVTGGTSNPISTAKRAGLNVLKTTVTDANTIDWVAIDSQGTIAAAPPMPALRANGSKPTTELQVEGAEFGPPGTVPIPRVNTQTPAFVKQLPPRSLSEQQKSKRQYSGVHWYVSSDQNVISIGGSAVYSLFKAFVQNSGDFSLLQTAVTKSNVPMPNNPTVSGGQTLEAGWINYPQQVAAPHLFTYYTTCNYQCSGDNQGGWNRDQAGWVQVDTTYFPGTVFTPLSVDGGQQVEMQIEYQLFSGNWWLFVVDRWIGYYPASLFSAGEANAAVTLAQGSDTIYYYGEIYNSENAMTTTDMGSGEFASAGSTHAAYIHNMVYLDSSVVAHDYTAGFGDSDSSRYSHAAFPSSGGSWGSYVYLGGPGAGGQIGA